MTLFNLKKGEKAIINSISFGGSARARLSSLGVTEGKTVTVLSFSLFKSAVLLSCGYIRLGIRRALATQIEVEKC
ncbi:MAG: ferrous iron transport protein A [Clostridia bacterium]|nr:ferrous iron transport protein A [Clostridia bacterium]